MAASKHNRRSDDRHSPGPARIALGGQSAWSSGFRRSEIWDAAQSLDHNVIHELLYAKIAGPVCAARQWQWQLPSQLIRLGCVSGMAEPSQGPVHLRGASQARRWSMRRCAARISVLVPLPCGRHSDASVAVFQDPLGQTRPSVSCCPISPPSMTLPIPSRSLRLCPVPLLHRD